MTVIVITLVILVLAINTQGSAVLLDDPELSSASDIYRQATLQAFIRNLESRNFRGNIDSSTKKFIAYLIAMGLRDSNSRQAFLPITSLIQKIQAGNQSFINFSQFKRYLLTVSNLGKSTTFSDLQHDPWYHLLFMKPTQESHIPSFPATNFMAGRETEILDHVKFANFPSSIPVVDMESTIFDVLLLQQEAINSNLTSIVQFGNWISDYIHSVVYTNNHVTKNMLRRRTGLPELNSDNGIPMLQITCRFNEDRAFRYEWTKVRTTNPSIYYKIFRDYPFLQFIITADLVVDQDGRVILKASHISCVKPRVYIVDGLPVTMNTGNISFGAGMNCTSVGARGNIYYHDCKAAIGGRLLNNAIFACSNATSSISHAPFRMGSTRSNTRFTTSDGCSIVDQQFRPDYPIKFRNRIITKEWTNPYQRSQPRFSFSPAGEIYTRNPLIEKVLQIFEADGYVGENNGRHFVDLTFLTDYCLHAQGSVNTNDLKIRCPGILNPLLKSLDSVKTNRGSGFDLIYKTGDLTKSRSDPKRSDHFEKA